MNEIKPKPEPETTPAPPGPPDPPEDREEKPTTVDEARRALARRLERWLERRSGG